MQKREVDVDEKGIYSCAVCNLGTGDVSMVLGCFGGGVEHRFPVLLSGYITAFRTVSNDFRVLSPMLMIFHKLTSPHNDEVERNSIREEDREGWNDGDPESWKRL